MKTKHLLFWFAWLFVVLYLGIGLSRKLNPLSKDEQELTPDEQLWYNQTLEDNDITIPFTYYECQLLDDNGNPTGYYELCKWHGIPKVSEN